MRLNFTKMNMLRMLCILILTLTVSAKTYSQAILFSGFENAKPPAPAPGWTVSHTGNANWASLRNFMGAGNALNGQKCMFLDKSYYGDQSDAWLYTPAFQVEAGKKYSISFYYKNQVDGTNSMQVTMGNDTLPAAQTEIVWEKTLNKFLYQEGQINYTATETGTKVLAFHCNTPKTYVYIYIDDVTIKEVTCFEPLNIEVGNVTTNTAKFKWDAVADAQGYVYGISTELTPPANTKVTDRNSINISGLKSSRKYYLYVKSFCSPGQGSDWVTKEFSTSYDVAEIEPLSCGDVISNNFKANMGLYLDKQCGSTYIGREFFHTFTPVATGYYNLDVLAVNTGQYMKFMYKEASLGAGAEGWKCIIQEVNDFGGKAMFGPLEAGKEYIIMEKARAAVGLPSSYSYAIECFNPLPPNDS